MGGTGKHDSVSNRAVFTRAGPEDLEDLSRDIRAILINRPKKQSVGGIGKHR